VQQLEQPQVQAKVRSKSWTNNNRTALKSPEETDTGNFPLLRLNQIPERRKADIDYPPNAKPAQKRVIKR